MPRYSDLADRVVNHSELLHVLIPTAPLNYDLSRKLRDASDADLAGGATISDPAMFPFVRGALLYGADELDAAHRIFQDEPSSLGSYWHGMMHRREGDFDNARYWFRRAGRLGIFGAMQDAARGASPDMAKQSTWDAYLLTGQCEQVKHGARELTAECVALQLAEFKVLFDDCWQKAMGNKQVR
jgi:hypothetical protein